MPIRAVKNESIPDPLHHLYRLDNGLMVGVFPMPWLHEVGATLMVRAGSRFEEPHHAGIAHFLEHMLFKGTVDIPDPTGFHGHLESMAADMNAATGQETNAYWITLPAEWLQEGFTAFCDMFTRPALSDIETERRVILEEMREDENDQGELAVPSVLGAMALWPGHPLARSVLGSRETVARIQVPALREYLARHYRGGSMALSFCGPIEPSTALELARSTLGKLPAGVGAPVQAPVTLPPGPHWVAVDDQSSQFSLSLYFRTQGFRDTGYYPTAALRRLLDDGFSSRLQAVVRERRGLAYDVWSAFTTHSDAGFLEVGATLSPDHLEEAFQVLFEQLDSLVTAPPDPEEWQRLLIRWRAGLLVTLDHPSELIERYVGDRLFEAAETLDYSWKQAYAIDPGLLPTFAARLLRPENLAVVLIGPNARKTLPRLKQAFARFSRKMG
ncbi:MAG: insulinase family protein [Magnetococcales bacterium]|nr:insulinase family protein [Magnetococcales bacterium]